MSPLLRSQIKSAVNDLCPPAILQVIDQFTIQFREIIAFFALIFKKKRDEHDLGITSMDRFLEFLNEFLEYRGGQELR